ncbi:MAG: M28 family peptidase [Acidobacteriia bacterium]|nr:M28 family peptidase [Terriglobia bacterium]
MVFLLGCKHDSPPAAPANAAVQAAAPAPSSAQSSPTLDAPPVGPVRRIDAARAMQYTREIFALGPRYVGGRGQQKIAAYLRAKLKNDGLEEDAFEDQTPAGKKPIRNMIAKFQGSRDGIIVLASHFDTNYPLRDTSYAGANDGASSTALLLAIADQLRGTKLEGFSIWLAFLDGEEAVDHWTATDSLYGSRHLAARWEQDGTLPRIKAFLLADMIGDADLNIDQEQRSTPWLRSLVLKAATGLGYQSHFFGRELEIEDDHVPFLRRGVPAIDLIDMDYGYRDSFHHTVEDTLDKLSPRSLQITGDVILETIRLLNGNAARLPGMTTPSKLPS